MLCGNGIPSSFVQGDSVSLTYSNPGFPSSSWTLRLAMIKDGAPVSTLPAATANADGSFTINLAPAITAALAPGKYTARLIVTSADNSQRESLCQSGLFIFPDLTQALPQTPTMQTLAALKSAQKSLAVGTIQSFTGGGQTWTKKNLAELQTAIDRFQAQVDNELTALGLSNNGGARTILSCF